MVYTYDPRRAVTYPPGFPYCNGIYRFLYTKEGAGLPKTLNEEATKMGFCSGQEVSFPGYCNTKRRVGRIYDSVVENGLLYLIVLCLGKAFLKQPESREHPYFFVKCGDLAVIPI